MHREPVSGRHNRLLEELHPGGVLQLGSGDPQFFQVEEVLDQELEQGLGFGHLGCLFFHIGVSGRKAHEEWRFPDLSCLQKAAHRPSGRL